jgi:hypothetical protein
MYKDYIKGRGEKKARETKNTPNKQTNKMKTKTKKDENTQSTFS